MGRPPRRAQVEDIHATAGALPRVTVEGAGEKVVYQVAGKSFVIFREPRPDALDPETGDRLSDVVIFWVADEADKQELVQDRHTPYFTTPHFDGHRSVLLRQAHLSQLSAEEVAEMVQDAWLARAPKRLAREWLAAQELPARR